MTKEQNHNDPHISEAYQDLATERTPPELDRKVLSMAAAGPRSRYGLTRAWIRPVAWAATISLSLAFVLELSQLRNGDVPHVDADAVDVLEDRVVRDEAPVRAKDDRRQESAKRTDAPMAKQVSSPPAAAEPAAAPEPALESTSVSADFEADGMNLLREAEEQARVRSGSERPESAVAASTVAAGAAAYAEKKEYVERCDSAARATVETWYACILELRDRELAEAADQELESLLMKFPGFEEPDVNR